ncbi:bactoprenol glucosyl transferase [Ruthenibacterium lactatiformans]|mgnify:FL=1|uniref:Bactoprenol glucosyl transferase n=1 Tax=Ruthenibacterium lactatiformans TaxID=1550024 RepID=A0A0W7TLJ6_9FIRM|nr:glycosyltransferase family 2 protein [Ruthenibacterium lactatiformans]KUE74690.1 bactoprenol glucosyl transferase [Ruthenibacterium lactatiformans]MCQ5088395.1 glycosyltransferase family 2 protein [Ruthenibacterium lactatiformans]
MSLISIVVPCYNEEESLPLFYQAILEMKSSLPEVDFEFIFVNDGSKDNTLKIMRSLAQQDANVHYVSFSRNFGKEAALLAGLAHAQGDYVAVMDADLQDPPALLPEMYETLQTKMYDCVATRRVTRAGEPPIRSFFARMFYKLINKISKTEIVDGARDFRLMTRQMVNAILSVQEYNRFSKGIFGWVGFRTKWLEYKNIERAAGQTKWSFWKLFVYSLDGITAFSTVPLSVAAVMGMLFCFLAFAMLIFVFVRALIWGDPVGGWPSLVCIILFVGGIQLFCTGILGQYLSKTYLEVKRRPQYIIQETEKDYLDKTE